MINSTTFIHSNADLCPTCQGSGHTEKQQTEHPYARVVGITDIPTHPVSGEMHRTPFCKELLRQVEKLENGKALMIEFDNRRELMLTRTVLHRLIKYLDLPYKIRMAEVIMWIYPKEEPCHS